jgi:hypothetical protein
MFSKRLSYVNGNIVDATRRVKGYTPPSSARRILTEHLNLSFPELSNNAKRHK